MKKVLWTMLKYCACMLLIAAMLLSAVACGKNNGNTDVIVKSEHYSVTVPMMSYMVKKEYENLCNMYNQFGAGIKIGSGPGGTALDVNKPLKEQNYSVITDEATGKTVTKTWFDYFADIALEDVKTILALCEQARAAGFTLPEAEHGSIRAELDALKTYAAYFGMTQEKYLSAIYGSDVRCEDIEAMMELERLAACYSEAKKQEYRDGFEADRSAVEAYYVQNVSDYDQYMDFYCFTFETEILWESDDLNAAIQAYNEERALYRSWVERLNDCSSFDEFSQLLNAYIWAYENGADPAEAPDPTPISREALEGMVYVDCDEYSAPREISHYLFEDGRTSGDHFAIFNEPDESSSAQYTIVWITRGMHRSKQTVRSVGHILLKVQQPLSGSLQEIFPNGSTTVVPNGSMNFVPNDLGDNVVIHRVEIIENGAVTSIPGIRIEDIELPYDVVGGESIQIVIPSGGIVQGVAPVPGVSYATREEALAKADEILAELEAAGGLTQATKPNGTTYQRGDKAIFENIGAKYTCDSYMFYDDIYRGQMVEEFEDWVFDASRTEGEIAVIETGYGVHIMYYVGDESERWFVDALKNMTEDAWAEYLNTSLETYPVTVTEEHWDQIAL